MSIPHLRRKNPKDLPKLPLSVFTPPNSGTLDAFPVPPSPSNLQPLKVVDAHVVSADLTYNQWKKSAGRVLTDKTQGLVLALPGADLQTALNDVKDTSIIAVIVPFDIEKPDPAIESLLSAPSSVPISLSTIFYKSSAEAIEGLKWALRRGRPVDIDIQAPLSDSLLEELEDMITKASYEVENLPPIILSNILPPPHDLELPIVKLMNHPTYLAFQSQVAALSLFANVYVKFLPPVWNAPTPQTPLPGSPIESAETQQLQEWKRRIKMYLGPVMEAFGYQRIVFGTSPSSSCRVPANAGDWYEIARESLAELGVEQEFVDGVFCENAHKVYGRK